MYMEDLSRYRYHRVPESDTRDLRAVGWLDAKHNFPTGPVSARTLDRLLHLCTHHRTSITRGYHVSDFVLPKSGEPYRVQYEGRLHSLGSAEIRVLGRDGITYIAPTLIYHYVKDLGYLPPSAFADAVENGQPQHDD